MAGLASLPAALHAQSPEWIWPEASAQDNEVCFFRKTITMDTSMRKAVLLATGDDEIVVYLDGKKVLEHNAWQTTAKADVTDDLDPGPHTLAIRGKNVTGDAAVVAMLEITKRNKEKAFIVTDASWLVSKTEAPKWQEPGFADQGWAHAVSRGKVGVAPWGDVFTVPTATAAEKLKVLPGFKVELLRSAEPGEGSWVSMTIDPQGRLIVSPQDGTGNLLRIALDAQGNVGEIKKIDAPVGSAMGLLYAFDSLYVNGRGPDNVLGLYRLADLDHQGHFAAPTLVKKIEGADGEHGSHGVVLGKDQHLYVINGNFTHVPEDIAATSQHRHYAEDQLLPRGPDGNGFGNDIQPPGGFLLRTDSEGKAWELYAAGMRNTYDFAINPEGEIFGFDSDMEYDWGMPWYRPIRVMHLVSGGEYGFREGTGKWPKYYPDSLPSTVDVGIGSPTGLKFGTGAHYPRKYQRALYAMDWAYGRILAVHLQPDGASYSATFENFVSGQPLNVTDLEIGRDGAMYFITGGRGTQSGLYRVTHANPLPAEPVLTAAELAAERAAADARAVRHSLERYHGRVDPGAVNSIWPHLDSPDRFIRYAARIALESQPVAEWQARALAETSPNAALTALLALARVGPKDSQAALLNTLALFPLDGLSEAQKLEKLRLIEVSFIRQGRPTPELTQLAVTKLDRQYPAKSEALNHELAELLIYLEAPGVVGKTLALLDQAQTLEEQVHYVFHLRNLKHGWTLPEREHYFSWLNAHGPHHSADIGGPAHPWKRPAGPEHAAATLQWFKDVGRDYGDGASYDHFIENIRHDVLACLAPAERDALAAITTDHPEAKPKPAKAPPAKQRTFIKEWKMTDLQSELDRVGKGRSFRQGQEVFAAAQCLQCHRFGNEGGAVGPDLTAVSSRFARRDVLESILEPSKVVSEQFMNTVFTLKNGDEVTGRIADENEQRVLVTINPLAPSQVEVKKSEIASRTLSKISPMPEGLVNQFTEFELLDLLAYLESGGKPTAANFKP